MTEFMHLTYFIKPVLVDALRTKVSNILAFTHSTIAFFTSVSSSKNSRHFIYLTFPTKKEGRKVKQIFLGIFWMTLLFLLSLIDAI